MYYSVRGQVNVQEVSLRVCVLHRQTVAVPGRERKALKGPSARSSTQILRLPALLITLVNTLD